MGLLNNIMDKGLKSMTGNETIRVSYNQLAEMVKDKFIMGQNSEYLEKVRKTAKGGFILFDKKLKTQDERYEFYVGLRPTRLVWLPSKPAWIFDNTENKFYQLDKDIRWKKFYITVKKYVDAEMINKNK